MFIYDSAIEGAIQGAIGGALGLGPIGDFIQGVAWDKIVKGKSWNEAIENGIQGAIIGAGTDFALSKGNLDDFIDRTWAGIKDDVGKVKGVAKSLKGGLNRLDNALRGVDDAIENSLERKAKLGGLTDASGGGLIDSPNSRSLDYCPNSFSEDTNVATSEGDIDISDLEEGDTVFAYNEETGEVGEYEVTAIHIHDDPIIVHLTIDGELVETTPEHPFYSEERGWVNAGELLIGEHIRKLDGGYGTVESVESIEQTQTMYNLTVDEAHTFFVGEAQWLVHNCGVGSDDFVHIDIGGEGAYPDAINVNNFMGNYKKFAGTSDIPNLVVADGNRLPFAGGSVDKITAENIPLGGRSGHNIPNEIARVIKPGGEINLYSPIDFRDVHEEIARKVRAQTIRQIEEFDEEAGGFTRTIIQAGS